jgi:hypothetical protein
MNRYEVAAALAHRRVATRAHPALTGAQRTAATAAIDEAAYDLAYLLPPGQRDQFLIAVGVPRA